MVRDALSQAMVVVRGQVQRQPEKRGLAKTQSTGPKPPPGAPTSELFSPNETSDLFGFLDNFNWEFDALNGPFASDGGVTVSDGYFGGFEESLQNSNRPGTGSSSSLGTDHANALRSLSHPYTRPNPRSTTPTSQSSTDPQNGNLSVASPSTDSASTPLRAKPLLTDPQKRMNHIMSEQKRRNAIREGYAQLTALIAPAGAPPGTGMPTRGRPKGSGARGKGRPGAGKSGVLLRAVEYIRWLEDGKDALLEEVMRVESAAGIRVDIGRV
ncbi:hypothetical protein SCHPADRAFT_916974 [Schizopora paradoxa]|uniref:BHLH domain-containing protein n=1 Tax=Schizopora paradoxa TaxID=27342 RepID=A0A0H2R8Z5_9AGAM|nr:hypothetical protein SCHPADRAFT_916974 [Schizopora paradoxa]